MTTRRADGVATIVRDLWTSRELIDQLVRRDVRLRYRQAIMGFAWALLMPALTIAAGLVIKGALARGGGETPSLAGIALKSWAWAFFAGAMNFATMSLLSNISLVTKIWFPREVLPVSAVLAQCVDSFVGLVILALIAPLLGMTLGWSILWLPVLLLLLLSFTTGLAFLFACANIFFRDVKYILQVLLTFGIFFTPVLMEPSQMGRYAELVMMNPLSPILEGLRLAVTAGHNLLTPLDIAGVAAWRPWWLGYSAIWSFTLLWAGLRFFRGSAARFAEAY
ncbi:MAG: ABC transporter permease [Gemmatimonadetes bacterium]|nr:ABC transporter permease [Gemmatimonadota bacterium]MBL0179937.1 ABC transporter permease [Gemmatimonadota bacterium]